MRSSQKLAKDRVHNVVYRAQGIDLLYHGNIHGPGQNPHILRGDKIKTSIKADDLVDACFRYLVLSGLLHTPKLDSIRMRCSNYTRRDEGRVFGTDHGIVIELERWDLRMIRTNGRRVFLLFESSTIKYPSARMTRSLNLLR
ncbi:hypothetical protein MPTK1_2g05960 [Marchantia polymorpha subsp. ruderalis]|nr:hypothetical protein Mp_2g05960 [Marchantia polymorpha subsp. ruderalis]